MRRYYEHNPLPVVDVTGLLYGFAAGNNSKLDATG